MFARVSVVNRFFLSLLLLLFSSSYSTGRPRIFTNHVVCAAPESPSTGRELFTLELRSNRSINRDSFLRQQEESATAVSDEIYLTDRCLKKKKRNVDAFFNRFYNGNNFAISVLRHMTITSKNSTTETRFAAHHVHVSYYTYFRTKLASFVNRILINSVQYGPMYILYIYSEDHGHRPKTIVNHDGHGRSFHRKEPTTLSGNAETGNVYFYYFVFLYFGRYVVFLRQQ